MKMVVRCGVEYEAYECAECGSDVVASYTKSVREKMVGRCLCFSCNYWADFLKTTPTTIIDGRVYTPGNRTSGAMRGMAGRRFDIEYISGPHAGKKVTTFDLWAGSDIPERYRHKFPDTARFLNGGAREVVGGTVCWNPSSESAPEYPLPAKAGVR